jgi:hypothetical protein
MKEPTLISEGVALVEHYEALRKDIVDFDGYGQRMHGLALLMRKGMAAWMKGVGEQSVGIAASVPPSAALPLPVGIEQHLVDILATMALATAWEGIA